MNIAFINNTKIWGGPKTWVIDMARSAIENGHKAIISGRDPVFLDKAKSFGIPAIQYFVGGDYNPFAIKFFYSLFKKEKIDVVIVNTGKDVRSAGFAGRLLGIPVVQRIGAWDDFKNSFQVRMDAKLLNLKFLSSSHFTLEEMKRHAPHVNKYTSFALHPGVFMPDSIVVEKRAVPQLIVVARLYSRKNHVHLFEALLMLKKKGINLPLTVLGSGPEEGVLKKYVNDNDLNELITFIPFSNDVESYLKKADVLILPSKEEGLGIALQEAMAYGLIPVARNAGGVPEIFPKNLPRLLIDPSLDAKGFADALEYLASISEDERERLRYQVYEHAKVSFEQNRQFLRMYEWLKSLK